MQRQRTWQRQVVATPWAHLFVVLPWQPLAAVQNVCEVGRRAKQAERHDLDCPSAATDLMLIALQLLELVVLGSGEVRPLGIVLGCFLRRHARRRLRGGRRELREREYDFRTRSGCITRRHFKFTHNVNTMSGTAAGGGLILEGRVGDMPMW